MVEDQGKGEEKFDFTGEGEAVNYISLAQARLFAMQTAGETAGNYGGQYQDISMAFEVSNGQDTQDYEDFYTISCPSGPRATFPAHRAGPPQSGIIRSHLFRDLQFSRWALGFC
jgi:hypothetical protein